MNNTYDLAHIHALRYALEATKVFLMEKYMKDFPYLFTHAHLEVRPATPEDYYVPPALAGHCIVVKRTYFDEIACQRFSCFPFKQNGEMCTEQDPPQWVTIGEHFEVACQYACRDHPLTTEWIQGKCKITNTLKKYMASMPPKLFERDSRLIYHGGLNVVEGTLKANKHYCEAYGLDFMDGYCTMSGAQSFYEWLLGVTTYRASKTATIKPFTTNLPKLPAYLNYQVPQKRKTRSTEMDVIDPNNNKVFKEIALALVEELGEEVSEWAVEMFLRKKAPKVLGATVDFLSAKLVIKYSIAMTIKRVGLSFLMKLGKGFSAVTNVFTLYDLVGGVLDILDTYDFNKVLDKKTLQQLDRKLDYQYFQDEIVNPELTPEYIWDHELLTKNEDESDKFQFMVERVEEYLTALHAAPPSQKELEKPKLKLFEWKEEENWNKKLFVCFIIISVCFVCLFIEYIDVWVMCLFFMKLYYGI